MESLPKISRRSMMRNVLAGAALSVASSPLSSMMLACRPKTQPIPPLEFKSQLRGAVLSIPTPFTKEMSVDFAGVRRMIERAVPHDIRVFSLTSGNSQYASLSYDEIKELTREMVKAANGNGLTIASTDLWDIAKSVEYAHFSESIGANGLQVLRPDTEDDDFVVEYFQTVANETRLPLVLHGNFSHALLERLLEIESIVAMKEDVGLEYYIQLQRKFGERLAIFEGGPAYAFLVAYPYGARASYTTLGTFVPHVTKQFWSAIDRGDLPTAYELVKKYEHPFFDRWSHAFWRASLEHFGVAARYLRPPQTYFTDEQMRDVAKFYRRLGLS